MVASPLISTADLAGRLADPAWVIADCRFDLSDPKAGHAAWLAGHVPGAIHMDLERHLSVPVTPQSGRHPLPSMEAFAATLSGLGIGNGMTVCAYDAGNGAYASRLWWMLRHAGHDAVRVLDGGFAAWVAEGRAVSTETDARPRASFVAQPRGGMLVDAASVADEIAAGGLVVDVRGAERFRGDVEPLDAVAGHVPGAANLPFLQNLGAGGRFLPADALARQWRERVGAEPGRAITCMCGSGVTACQGLLALEIAGIGGGRLYAGSWSEWIRDPSRPIARGPA